MLFIVVAWLHLAVGDSLLQNWFCEVCYEDTGFFLDGGLTVFGQGDEIAPIGTRTILPVVFTTGTTNDFIFTYLICKCSNRSVLPSIQLNDLSTHPLTPCTDLLISLPSCESHPSCCLTGVPTCLSTRQRDPSDMLVIHPTNRLTDQLINPTTNQPPDARP